MDDEGTFWETGDIIIEGDTITALGDNLSPEHFHVQKILPAQNHLAIPGLVNAHLHSHDRFDKGRFDNLPLEIWMALYNPPLGKRNWTPREAYLRTIVNAVEMLKSGTTTVIDDVVHGSFSEEVIDAVFQAYQDIGMRALVSIHFSDQVYHKTIPYLEDLLPESLKQELSRPGPLKPDEVLQLWRRYAKRWRGRVGFILAPSAPMRCTDEFLKKTWQLSKELDLRVIVHFMETKVQVITSQLFYGSCLADHMESLGILTPRTSLVHCVWASDQDLARIQDSGSSVIHNPVSNAKLGCGIAPIRKILERGIPVGLGTDNINANDSANLLEAMKLAALLNKIPDFNYERWVGAKDVLNMATRGGAICAGLEEEIASLSVGRKADIILLDLKKAPFFPRNNLVHQLVFCEHGESVDTVIVGGKIVVEKGQMVAVDEQKMMNELVELEDGIKEKICRAAARGAELEPYLRKAYFKCVQQNS